MCEGEWFRNSGKGLVIGNLQDSKKFGAGSGKPWTFSRMCHAGTCALRKSDAGFEGERQCRQEE